MRRKDREITNIEDIINILKGSKVCRVAFSDEKAPYIVAMNFGFEHNTQTVLYFHTAKTGKKLDLMQKNNHVCFQVDAQYTLVSGKKACDYTMIFKSIVGYGNLTQVEEKVEKEHALNLIMKQYTEKEHWEYSEKRLEAICILRLNVTSMTGKSNEK